jgi:hypothetical protein
MKAKEGGWSCWELARSGYYDTHAEEFKSDALAHVGLTNNPWAKHAYDLAVNMAEVSNRVPNGGFPWSDCLEYLRKLADFSRKVVENTHDVTYKGPQICVSVPLSELDNERDPSIIAIRVEDETTLAAAFITVKAAQRGHVRFYLSGKGRDFRTETKVTTTAKINPKIKRG